MTMKRFLMLLTSVLFCINMGAQEGYHNTTAGKTLKWSIHDGDDKLFGYCHETLVSMEGDETNARIDYSYMFYDSSNQPVIASPFEFYATISDGKTSAYVNFWSPHFELIQNRYTMNYDAWSTTLSTFLSRRWTPDYAILTLAGGISSSLQKNTVVIGFI